MALAFSAGHPAAAPIAEAVGWSAPALAGASLNVSPDDDMFSYSLGTVRDVPLGALAYFRTGLQLQDAVAQLADWWFGGLAEVGSVLDFAAGYGRSTRFLVLAVPPERVWAAEIQPDALAFQHEAFGVHTLLSTTEPERLRCDRTFDLIVVVSLFSHLPERTFVPWLRRLYELLAPGGLLAFSTHDESLARDVTLGESGLTYLRTSEVGSLDLDDYGVAFVSEGFVRGAVKEATGSDEVVRLGRGLLGLQDLYLLGRERPLGDGPPLRGPVAGHVDLARVGDGRLTLAGWAADLDRRPLARVEALVDGRLAGATTGPWTDRPDVAAALGHPGSAELTRTGWTLSVRAPRAHRSGARLLVGAVGTDGRRTVVDAGLVGGVVGRTGGEMPPPPFSVRRKLRTAVVLTREEGVAALGRRARQLVTRR